MASYSLKCFECGHAMTYTDLVGRRDECPQCGADVHVCRNCAHYDPKVYNECREPQAEVVREKDRANYCDFFSPHTGDRGAQGTNRDSLMSAAEALFKKK